MSENSKNVYTHYKALRTKEGATAAAIDMVSKACRAGGETHKEAILEWVSKENNLKTLRDKIISCATE